MANDIVPFGVGQVPAHIKAMQEALGSNIKGRSALNTLGTENSLWTVNIEGNKVPLMETNSEGDEVKRSVIRVVLLDYNERSGRKFYEGKWESGVSRQPSCWSPDGKLPDPSVATPQAASCAECPRSVKGSKVENGKSSAECSQHKLAVVALYKQPNMPPLRLQLSQTGDFDTRSQESLDAKWFALRQYENYFKTGGAQNSAAILTKLRFNPKNTGPQVQFQVERWLSEAESKYYTQFVKDNQEEIKNLLSSKFTPAGSDGVATDSMIPPAQDEPDETGPAVRAAPGAPAATVPTRRRTATRAPGATTAPAAPAPGAKTAPAYEPIVPDFLKEPEVPAAPAAGTRSVLDVLKAVEAEEADPEEAIKAEFERKLAEARAAKAAKAATPAPAPAAATPATTKPPAAPQATQPVTEEVAGLMEDWGD